MNIPSKETRAKWRKDFSDRMLTSAIWEYCPEEFGELLDAVDELERKLNEQTQSSGSVRDERNGS